MEIKPYPEGKYTLIIIPIVTIPVNITINQTKAEVPPPHPVYIAPILSHKREPFLWRRRVNALKKWLHI
ncbi:hypothetical protein [Pectobacterium cacticida]|uniref:hypothetical protein n=1 Tax=Pectobacterium cacticida TaxID=69221 RepID=UPI003986D3E6